MERQDLIDEKYIKLQSLGKLSFAEAFKVEEKETKKIYAAKIFSFDNNHHLSYLNEKKMLKKFQDKNNHHIVNLIDSGEVGNSENKKYLILEYCKNGDLSKYIKFGKGLNLLHVKLLFQKILIAVNSIHKNNICHRDLKPANILLDDNYNPKICNFELAKETKIKFVQPSGSFEYVPLEVFQSNINSVKIDIFALGIVLYNLVTGFSPFPCVIDYNKYINSKFKFYPEMINPKYKLIIKKEYKDFWEIEGVSKDEDFKKLFEKMIDYNPFKRPNIDEILKDPFFNEINTKSEKGKKDLEIEMKVEFDKIREQLKENNTNENVNIKSNKNEDIPKEVFLKKKKF